MKRTKSSPFSGLPFILFCVLLSSGLIALLRILYTWLSKLHDLTQSTLTDSIITLLEIGLTGFGYALFLVVIFTLVEIKTTGRRRSCSSYLTTFSFLLLSFIILTAIISQFDKLLASFDFDPFFDLTAEGTSSLISYPMILGYFFITDILLYWTHRLEHTNKALWHLHKIHHAFEDLDSMSGVFHPISDVVRWVLTILPLKLLVVINLNDALALAAFMGALHYFQHTRAPFDFGWFGYVLGDNRFHFVHHSTKPKHYNKNFAAMFPVIDMMFGTYLKPESKVLPKTGLSNYQGPKTTSQFLTGNLKKR